MGVIVDYSLINIKLTTFFPITLTIKVLYRIINTVQRYYGYHLIAHWDRN